MADGLVQPLFDGPLDIVGDVHGEVGALAQLLDRLGYDESGNHPQGRRLVFVGDLTDRGPDSLAAVEFVQSCVERGLAQCVLGNHDLNLLLGRHKYDNSWFFGEEFCGADGNVVPQRLASESDRKSILHFFASLPLALHRPGLRVVHAYWDHVIIGRLTDKSDVVELYQHHADALEAYALCRSLPEVDRELLYQNDNPIKLITSGPEQQAAAPFEASGKLRKVERVQWWHDYGDEPLCVFGHYSLDATHSRHDSRAICIDYGAYKRRGSDKPFKLAALRVPEMCIVSDDGGDIQLDLTA